MGTETKFGQHSLRGSIAGYQAPGLCPAAQAEA